MPKSVAWATFSTAWARAIAGSAPGVIQGPSGRRWKRPNTRELVAIAKHTGFRNAPRLAFRWEKDCAQDRQPHSETPRKSTSSTKPASKVAAVSSPMRLKSQAVEAPSAHHWPTPPTTAASSTSTRGRPKPAGMILAFLMGHHYNRCARALRVGPRRSFRGLATSGPLRLRCLPEWRLRQRCPPLVPPSMKGFL